MKRLTEVKPETKAVIKNIEGGKDIKDRLGKLGFAEGAELTLLAVQPVHVHTGPVRIKVDDKEVIIPQGWADKILVARDRVVFSLLMLEEGDTGVVKAIGSGKAMEKMISELGINIGAKVEFLTHLPHQLLNLKVDEKRITTGPGSICKILVEVEGKHIQLNYLGEGKEAKISKVFGGDIYQQEMGEVLKEGAKITVISKEPSTEVPHRKGTYVLARLGEQMISIGHDMAEKIWVE